MKVKQWEHRSRIVMEWRCHGQVWQLKMITLKRRTFGPTCQVCGKTGYSFNMLEALKRAREHSRQDREIESFWANYEG